MSCNDDKTYEPCSCGCGGSSDCNCDCAACEPLNCIEQAVRDALAYLQAQLEALVQRAETAAENSEASAKASADSAAESKEFRDEAEQAATTALKAESIVIGVANDLQDTADKLKRIADELNTAIAGIAVSTWYYTAVTENQTVIPVPADKNQVGIQAIYIEGVRQDPNRGFTYDALNKEIILAEGIPLGMEISIIIGAYSDNPNDFANTLASNNGASLVGTTSGQTVQQEINNLKQASDDFSNALDPILSRLADESGLPMVGTFEDGATVNTVSQSVGYKSEGKLYRWMGALPKLVDAGSTPENTGGIAADAWIRVDQNTLRGQLATNQGSSFVGYNYPALGTISRTVSSRLEEYVSVIDFGAKGDGTTDDTLAVQKALDTGVKEIVFPAGFRFKVSVVTIKTRGQCITGGGEIIGQVSVAMPKGTDIYTTIIAEVSIHNLTFSGSSSTNSIWLRRGRGIRISDCTFREVNVCVQVQPTAEDYDGGSHCIEDVMILNNTATLVNYFLYGDTSFVITGGVNWWMGCGDITVSKNICRVSKVSFIHADRMDGLIVEGNVMLNWGFSGAMPGKLYGVYIGTQGAQIIIKGNNIFETGYEGVRLVNCASVMVEGNNIVQCGQLKPSSAIYVSNGSAGQNTFLSIQNNLINEISGHPISVGNAKIGSVQGNTAYIGNRSYYYGATALPSVDSLFLVNLEGTNEGLVLENNSCQELVARGISPTSSGRIRPALYKYDVSSAVTSLDGTANRIHLNSPTAHTVGTVTGGYDGQVITLVTFTGNCTIGDAGSVSGGNILTDTGSNKLLTVNRLYYLTKVGNSWYLK